MTRVLEFLELELLNFLELILSVSKQGLGSVKISMNLRQLGLRFLKVLLGLASRDMVEIRFLPSFS